jgi:pimeloyl-ACP methyl ester carboxylesterase
MKRVGLIAAWAVVACGTAEAAPLEVYRRLPAIDSVKISPDGVNLALLVTNGDQRKIIIEDVATHKILTSINAGTQKVRDLRWAGDHHLLITASRTGLLGADVLSSHGKDDTVVPYAQREEMASALRAAGKPVEFVTLKGEDHWLSEGETRLRMLQATVDFLEKNNPPN